jgi:hypothetical protein
MNMYIKYRLLAQTGLAAVILFSSVAPAAATARRKPHTVSHKRHATQANGLAQEVAELKAQVAALTDRLEAQEAAQRITADQAATAASGTEAAAAMVNAKLAENSKAVSAQVKSAIAANTPKASWTADTKVTGRMFFNISNVRQQNVTAAGVATKVVPSGTGFDIKRLYIGVEHNFNKNISAVALIDAQANGAFSGGANLNGANFFIKNAYLQYKFNDALIVRAGAAEMPWAPYTESVYANRYIEQVLTDRSKIANTADWGVHVLGTLGDPKKLNVTYAVSAVNGGGFKNPTRSNSVDLEGRIAANYMGFTAGIGGYTGKGARDVQGATPLHTASRFNALLGYSNTHFRVGAEYFYAKDFANILTVAEDAAEGYSGYGTFYVTPKFSVFGRYDRVTPSKYLAPLRKDDYFNLGLTYSPAKIVDLSLVYKREKLNNNGGVTGGFATGNGTVGAAGFDAGTYDEFGVFGQWRF